MNFYVHSKGQRTRYVPDLIKIILCWLLVGALLSGSVRAQELQQQPHGLRAVIAKKVLRKAARLLRSKSFSEVCDKLAGYGGKKIANIIKRYRENIADVFDELATWDKVTQQIIKDQLTGALHGAGLAHSTASKVGFYIAEAFGWIVL